MLSIGHVSNETQLIRFLQSNGMNASIMLNKEEDRIDASLFQIYYGELYCLT